MPGSAGGEWTCFWGTDWMANPWTPPATPPPTFSSPWPATAPGRPPAQPARTISLPASPGRRGFEAAQLAALACPRQCRLPGAAFVARRRCLLPSRVPTRQIEPDFYRAKGLRIDSPRHCLCEPVIYQRSGSLVTDSRPARRAALRLVASGAFQWVANGSPRAGMAVSCDVRAGSVHWPLHLGRHTTNVLNFRATLSGY